MRTGRNFLEVSAADAAGVDADEHFSRANLRNRDSLHANVIDAAVHGGEHGRRDQARVLLERILSGNGHEVILDDVGVGSFQIGGIGELMVTGVGGLDVRWRTCDIGSSGRNDGG